MKKIGLLFATIIMMLVFAVSASAATEGYYTYEVENGEATITYVDQSISGDVTIPSTLGGYPVTAIGGTAFHECFFIKTVSIPDGVKTIGWYAFDCCCRLEEITIPDSIVTIAEGAFFNCFSLKKVIIPETAIGLKTIEAETFAYCLSLEDFAVPKSITSIGDKAFRECFSLQKLVINNPETAMGDNVVSASLSPKDMTYKEWVEKYLIAINSAIDNNEDFEENEQIAEVVEYTVFHEDDLKILPYVTIYGYRPSTALDYAVANHISFSLMSTTDSCGENLTWSFDEKNGTLTISGQGPMYEFDFREHDCPWHNLKDKIYNIIIEEGVTTIGFGAFSNCAFIERIVIPEGVTKIEGRAFNSCMKLKEITLPNSLVEIGMGAFYDCSAIEEIIIPETAIEFKSIGNNAFNACISLKEFIVPECVTSIGDSAFADCHSLEKLVINNSEIAIGDNIVCATVLPKNISSEEWVEICLLATDAMLEGDVTKYNELIEEWEKHTEFCQDIRILPNLTIYGYYESTAETYAVANGITFKNINECKKEEVDTSTGVKAEYNPGVFDENADMIITEGGKNANIVFSGKFGKYTSYDISFAVDGEKVQPNGTVTIKIPLPDSYNANSVKVFYVDDNGNKTKLDSKIENGYIVFETDHFSEYVIVDESSKIKEPVEPDDTDEPEVPDEPADSDEPSNDKDSCSCNCHKGGIAGFFFKIINFFQKLFGKNKICACGVKH